MAGLAHPDTEVSTQVDHCWRWPCRVQPTHESVPVNGKMLGPNDVMGLQVGDVLGANQVFCVHDGLGAREGRWWGPRWRLWVRFWLQGYGNWRVMPVYLVDGTRLGVVLELWPG